MIKVIPILTRSAVVAITAGCANGRPGGATAQSASAEKDYERLSGTWQLTRGVVNGRPVPASVLRLLIETRSVFQRRAVSGRIPLATSPSIRIRDPNKWIRSQK